MFCVSCGKAYEPNHKFCNYCGQPLTAPPAEAEPSASASSLGSVNIPIGPDSTSTGEASVSFPSAESAQAIPVVVANPKLDGLGGWLIFVAIGLFVGPCYWLYAIFQDAVLFNNGTVQFLSDPSSSVHIGGYSALLKFELVGNIILLGANLVLINLFFRRRSDFHVYILCFYWRF